MSTRRDDASAVTAAPPRPRLALLLRAAFGGVLMGLANLVPGISGGTMLLASGVYTHFITAVAELTTLRLRLRSVVIISVVVGAAGIAVAFLAGAVKDLVVDHRWVMYSLFIGLTLGGVPLLWSRIRPLDRQAITGALCGIAAMVAITLAQTLAMGAEGGAGGSSALILILAGLAGGSAMILPGVSGGYLLLVLGQYIVILNAIDSARQAVAEQSWSLLMEAMKVIVPVGIGVVAGVVVVSNLLRALLRNYEKPTLGFLLGLLLGAVVGLWPFQEPVRPGVGDVLGGRTLADEGMVEAIEKDDWPTEFFAPSALQVAGALGLIAAGLAVSLGISHLGRERSETEEIERG